MWIKNVSSPVLLGEAEDQKARDEAFTSAE